MSQALQQRCFAFWGVAASVSGSAVGFKSLLIHLGDRRAVGVVQAIAISGRTAVEEDDTLSDAGFRV